MRKAIYDKVKVNPVIAFTGHRPNKLGGYDLANPINQRIKDKMRIQIVKHNPSKIISGMALGVDTMAVEVCLELGIPLVVAIPFKGQECKWPTYSQEYYHELINKASEVVYVCEGEYAAWKLQRRNEWMVKHSDLLIAVWNGSAGGTGNCVSYATKLNKKIIRIDPSSFIGEMEANPF